MARTFRQRRRMSAVSDLNVTNLIDLAFTLLIIFMIATPLITQDEQTIPVNLPVESKREQTKPDKDTQFQAIMIDQMGRYYFGSTMVTMGDLRERLRKLGEMQKPPVIRIRADLTLQWQQVVALMDELKKSNLSRVTFDTQGRD